MPEKLDLIWYENATRPATEEREPANARQSGDACGRQAQQPAADQARKGKPEKVDWIWYEKPTFSATEEREPASVKPGAVANRQKPEEPKSAKPKNEKPVKAKPTA